MTLKFFFNRKGGVVMMLFAIGWLASLWNLLHLVGTTHRVVPTDRNAITVMSYLVFCFLALVITIIRFVPWYKKADRGYGIEEHFEKTFVPTAYILVVTNLIYFFWNRCWPWLMLVSLMLAVVQMASMILIYFHFKDRDSTPPSFLVRQLQ